MIMIIAIFLLSGLIKQTSAIQCYTCSPLVNFHCTLPVNLDGGDESNENDVEAQLYTDGFACMSDHTFDPIKRTEKIILRGINFCQEINIPNHRVHCCYTSNCNKHQPPMTVRTLSDMMGENADMPSERADFISNCQLNIPSIILIYLAIMLQYFYY